MSVAPTPRRWLVAGSIALLGLAVAIRIVVLAPPEGEDPLGMYTSSKQYQAGMEKIGGKAAVLGSELDAFFGSLLHGARLGYTIGIASMIVAGLSLAWRPPPEPPRPRA